MIKNISNETISAIKDGAVVELGVNAEIKIIGKSAVLTIDGKNYDWDEDEVNWVDNCVKQINDVITNHNTHKLYKIINEVGYVEVKENPATIITICDYILDNGTNSNWRNISEVFNHLLVGGEEIKAVVNASDEYYTLKSMLADIKWLVIGLNLMADDEKLKGFHHLIHKVENLKAYIQKFFS